MFILFFGSLFGLLLAGCKTTQISLPPGHKPADLPHLQVRVRATGSEIDLNTEVANDSKLENKFFACVEEVFREQGFTGKFTFLHGIEEIVLRAPALDVDITRWDRDSATAMECQATARYITLEAEFIDMGRYNTSDITTYKGSSSSREESFMDAGRAVARQLWRTLENADIAP